MTMTGPTFGVIPAGQSLITEPSEAPSPTSFLFSLPPPANKNNNDINNNDINNNINNNGPLFTHLVVFMLPGVVLPPDTAAAIYLSTASEIAAAAASGQPPAFRFLGGVGPGKESAVFKVNAGGGRSGGRSGGGGGGGDGGGGDGDYQAAAASASPLVLGISIEEAASVAARMQSLSAAAAAAAAAATTSYSSNRPTPAADPDAAAGIITIAPTKDGGDRVAVVDLAQKIIRNAFNFLASFSGNLGPGGIEVVPLKAFEGWWQKFESRIRSDPGFLDRQSD